MSGKSFTKVEMAKLVPGLFKVPDDLAKHLKAGSRAEAKRQKELAEFMAEREIKIIEAAKWLSHDGYLSFDTLNAEQFNRLVKSKAEREQYVKVSNVLGGLYSRFCTRHNNGAEEQLIAGKVTPEVNKIILAHRVKVDEWEHRQVGYKQLMSMSKKQREETMIRRGFYSEGKRGKKSADYQKLQDWVGEYPQLPKIEKIKVHHIVRTIKISLIMAVTKQVTVTKKVSDHKGGMRKKKMWKEVTTKTIVKEMIAPLDNEIKAGEIPGVVSAVVARLPRAGVPDWNTYEYSITEG